ncbi:glycosyl hydrolase [Victivallis vadensis]|uniref:glycosyl hydrolase n=1 Tax=Victivallis vadensis TaxID=172901 RepID=UPI00307D88AF
MKFLKQWPLFPLLLVLVSAPVLCGGNDANLAPAEWRVISPEAQFRQPNDATPVAIVLSAPPASDAESLAFIYYDYAGRECLTGTARYDAESRQLLAPPPPGRGFFDLAYPKLQIRFGVAVDEPLAGAPDEFFGVDGSFSWGGPPEDAEGIRSYLRILRQNGVIWNRDRFHWPHLEPQQGVYDFNNRYGLYHTIAGEEGIKTLDTFHHAPSWTGAQEPSWEYGTRSNAYPDNFFLAGQGLTAIAQQWKSTLAGLEVWNEPDFGFGSYFPPEYVTALTKAVSRSFAEAGCQTRVVGGVISTTRPKTGYYDYFVRNGLLLDCDVMSFHTYMDPLNLENEVRALREVELAWEPSRSGIPLWVTECGMPWNNENNLARADVPADLHSAAEITAKAVEMRAVGLERYFAFEYKFYQEGVRNFGMMDRNHTPMRSLAVYFHAARVLAHREYIGDLRGTNAMRSRVFDNGSDLVAVLYAGVKANRREAFTLPDDLPVLRATGADGRTLEFADGKVSGADGLVYLTLSREAKERFIDAETGAMRLYQIAKAFRPEPRQAKPLVLQAISDLNQFHVDRFGFLLPEPDATVKVWINNFSKESLEFVPEVAMEEGIELTEAPKAVTVPANGTAEVSFRLHFDAAVKPAQYRGVTLSDRNRNATRISFEFQPYETTPIAILPIQEMERDHSLDGLLNGKNWIDFSGAPYWRPWAANVMEPNIEARFRYFYSPSELVCQVLVKDPEHINNNEPRQTWLGDSLQLSIRSRAQDRKANGRWNEFCATRVQGRNSLHRERAWRDNSGELKKSKLMFIRFPQGYTLYELHLDGEENGLILQRGEIMGSALLVNSDAGEGRDGYLYFGQGIGDGKGDALFRLFQLK